MLFAVPQAQARTCADRKTVCLPKRVPPRAARTVVHREPAAALRRHRHPPQEGRDAAPVDAGQRALPAKRQQRCDRGVRRRQVRQLAGAAAVAAALGAARPQEGDKVVSRQPVRQRRAEQREGVEHPVADPGPARVERGEAGRQPPGAGAGVARVALALQRERVLAAVHAVHRAGGVQVGQIPVNGRDARLQVALRAQRRRRGRVHAAARTRRSAACARRAVVPLVGWRAPRALRKPFEESATGLSISHCLEDGLGTRPPPAGRRDRLAGSWALVQTRKRNAAAKGGYSHPGKHAAAAARHCETQRHRPRRGLEPQSADARPAQARVSLQPANVPGRGVERFACGQRQRFNQPAGQAEGVRRHVRRRVWHALLRQACKAWSRCCPWPCTCEQECCRGTSCELRAAGQPSNRAARAASSDPYRCAPHHGARARPPAPQSRPLRWGEARLRPLRTRPFARAPRARGAAAAGAAPPCPTWRPGIKRVVARDCTPLPAVTHPAVPPPIPQLAFWRSFQRAPSHTRDLENDRKHPEPLETRLRARQTAPARSGPRRNPARA